MKAGWYYGAASPYNDNGGHTQAHYFNDGEGDVVSLCRKFKKHEDDLMGAYPGDLRCMQCTKALKKISECGNCLSYQKPACPRGGGYSDDEICKDFIISENMEHSE